MAGAELHSLPPTDVTPRAEPASSDQASAPTDYVEARGPTTSTTSQSTTKTSTATLKPSELPAPEPITPPEFSPDDARAMSPRQSSENLAAICSESREKIQDSTLEHQSSLAALIEKIETVRTGHQKLERDNNALQEYIGGLTRSMSKTAISGGVGGGGVGGAGGAAGGVTAGVKK